MVPFGVEKDECEKAVILWLSEGDDCPEDILESTVITSFKGYYLPLYAFIGHFRGNWAASSGYTKQERYADRNFRDDVVERTRSVTEWKPVSGQIDDTFAFSIYAGVSRKDLNYEVRKAAEGFSAFGSGRELSKTGPYEFVDFAFDYHHIWSERGDNEVDRIARKLISNRIPGDERKDISFDVSRELTKAIAAYIPMWSLECRYKDELFNVCVDGADKSRVIGDRPEKPGGGKKEYLFDPYGALFPLFLPLHFLSYPFVKSRDKKRVEKGNQIRQEKLHQALARGGLRKANLSEAQARGALRTKDKPSNSVPPSRAVGDKSQRPQPAIAVQPSRLPSPSIQKDSRPSNYFKMGGIGCAIWILVFALFGVLLGEKVIAQNGPIATIIGIVIMLGAPAIVVVFVVGLVKRAKDKKE
jgi:hypothetical protein